MVRVDPNRLTPEKKGADGCFLLIFLSFAIWVAILAVWKGHV